MPRPAYSQVPAKTYSTVNRAVAAFMRACEALGIDEDMRYVVAADGDRFFPIALPTDAQIQQGISLAASCGITAIRT